MKLSKLCCGHSEQISESSESRTPAFQRFACVVGHVLNDIIRQLTSSFRLVFFMKVLGLSASNAGWLILYGKISHAAISQLSAFLVDKVNIPFVSRKLGRRKSWHWIGTVLGAVVLPLYFSSCLICQNDGEQWQMMAYVSILHLFKAFATNLMEIGHLSIILLNAKDQSETVELNAWRTGFSFSSGILTYLVAWGILGQDSSDHLSPESSLDFTVMTLILVGISLIFAAIFHIGSKEPSDDLAKSRFSNTAVDMVRKCSFIPSNVPLNPLIYIEYEKSVEDVQRKEWLCNHFIDSLKSKGRQNETEQEKISFSARFIDALISVDEDHKNETNEDPQNAHKATSEPAATKRLEVERSTLRETETHDCEETFKVVKGLPNARKRSLIMSIFGRLMGLDDCDVVNAKLSDMPKEANNFDLTKQYEGSTALEVSSYSSGIVINHTHETCATVAVSKLNKELNGLTNRQQGSQNKTVVANQDHLEMPEIKFGRDSVVFKKAAGIDNHGFDCNETESKQATPDQIDVTNVDKVYASQVMPESSQIHCGVESGTLMNGETDFKSTSPATPGTKTVKAWLKDFNLYKVGIVYTCARLVQGISYSYLPLFLTVSLKFEKEAIANLPLVVLISATISSVLTKKTVGKIGTKWTFILADLLVIGATLWCYFITQSTRVLIYPAAVFLGFGFSAMFVNALSFAGELVGENKSTSGFVFAFIGLMANLTGGALISAIQKFFPSGHESENCDVCGDYVRHVFSIVPGSLAAISLLIVLVFQTSQTAMKQINASQTDAKRTEGATLAFDDVKSKKKVTASEFEPNL